MSEHFVQMIPMLVLAGLTAGWLAEAVSRASRAGSYGFIPDIGLGLVGSVIAGSLVWNAISSEGGMLAMLLIGGVGGALAIIAQRTFWRSPQLEA